MTNNPTDPTNSGRKLSLTLTGGVVAHLSSQLYSGPVPAVVELIANAWDAYASRVAVEIPLDQSITAHSQIVVTDNGSGMSFEECDQKYLMLGRRKRDHEGQEARRQQSTDEVEPTSGRRVMGRKGIGKLAVFGIGNVLRIRTVKGNMATEFALNYEDVANEREYVGGAFPIDPIYDGPAAPEEQEGTRVTVEQLTLRRRISGQQFMRSLGRRFSVLSDDFAVTVNSEQIRREDMVTQFRFPTQGWDEEHVNGNKVRWWAGFSSSTIKDDDARGLVVLARGKLVQTPWFFDLSGGTYGQHGMQYMAGEVEADFLDEDIDLIATNRQSVAWDHHIASPLREWGETKVKWLLAEWARLRREENLKRLRASDRFLPLVERFSEPRKSELLMAIDKVASIPQLEEERLDEIVEFLISAYQSDYFYDAMRSINKALSDDEPLPALIQVLREWQILEATSIAQVVRGRIEIIRVFEKMIKERAPEKHPTRADMQSYLEENPWLLEPAYGTFEREPQLQDLLEREIGVLPDPEDPDIGRFPDFVTLAYGSEIVVVEVKRPGRRGNRNHYRQLEDYVHCIRRHLRSTTDQRYYQRVTGYLICSQLTADAIDLAEAGVAENILVVDWERLVARARELHREFFGVITNRVPQDDPIMDRLRRVDRQLQDLPENVE